MLLVDDDNNGDVFHQRERERERERGISLLKRNRNCPDHWDVIEIIIMC